MAAVKINKYNSRETKKRIKNYTSFFGSLFDFDSDVTEANALLEKYNLNSFQNRLFVCYSTSAPFKTSTNL